MKKIAYLCCTSLVLLTACAPPKVSNTDALQASNKTLATKPHGAIPTSFGLSGSIAAKSHQKGWTAMIDWQQSAPHAYHITLIGPMGSQAVRIEEQHGVVTYQEGAKKLTSSKGDDLLAKQTGIHLPVNNLYYWVRGLPAPGAVTSAVRDTNGQLRILKQSGYTIEYNEYIRVQEHILPKKIRLDGKDVVVKLVVKQWSI